MTVKRYNSRYYRLSVATLNDPKQAYTVHTSMQYNYFILFSCNLLDCFIQSKVYFTTLSRKAWKIWWKFFGGWIFYTTCYDNLRMGFFLGYQLFVELGCTASGILMEDLLFHFLFETESSIHHQIRVRANFCWKTCIWKVFIKNNSSTDAADVTAEVAMVVVL